MLPDWKRTIGNVGNDMMLLQTHVYFEIRIRELDRRIMRIWIITLVTNCVALGYLLFRYTHP